MKAAVFESPISPTTLSHQSHPSLRPLQASTIDHAMEPQNRRYTPLNLLATGFITDPGDPRLESSAGEQTDAPAQQQHINHTLRH